MSEIDDFKKPFDFKDDETFEDLFGRIFSDYVSIDFYKDEILTRWAGIIYGSGEVNELEDYIEHIIEDNNINMVQRYSFDTNSFMENLLVLIQLLRRYYLISSLSGLAMTKGIYYYMVDQLRTFADKYYKNVLEFNRQLVQYAKNSTDFITCADVSINKIIIVPTNIIKFFASCQVDDIKLGESLLDRDTLLCDIDELKPLWYYIILGDGKILTELASKHCIEGSLKIKDFFEMMYQRVKLETPFVTKEKINFPKDIDF